MRSENWFFALGKYPRKVKEIDLRFTFFLRNCFETKEQKSRVDVKSTAPATKLCHNEISCRFLFALLNSISSKQNEWNYWKHKAETIVQTYFLYCHSLCKYKNNCAMLFPPCQFLVFNIFGLETSIDQPKPEGIWWVKTCEEVGRNCALSSWNNQWTD